MSDYSKSQEYRVRDICRDLGLKAERVPLSGACHSIGKGDVIVEDGKVLIDHKSTRAKESIRIKRSDLEKIKKQAESGIGVLTFNFLGCNTVYAAVPLELLLYFFLLFPSGIINKEELTKQKSS